MRFLPLLSSLCCFALFACDVSSTGPLDSGSVDSGTGVVSDSGIPDSGVRDAGVEDSGVSDASDAAVDAGATIDAGSPDSGTLGAGLLNGALLGGPGTAPGGIVGVSFTTATVSGVTSAAGAFQFRAAESIQFQIGDIRFATTTAKEKISPFQLTGASSCTFGLELEKVLVLLFSLDADADPSNGISISIPAMTATRQLSSMSMNDVSSAIATWLPGRTALTAQTALDLFVRQVDAEAWAELSMDTFTGTTALGRGQGIASDGTSWFFSGTLSLERTDFSYTSQKSNSLAIPFGLALAGSDHIGDIDVYNGTLYAPVEDGRTDYKAPKIVQYNAQTLVDGTQWSIPTSLQTEGVPWVAVNGPAGLFYLAEWSNSMQLNIFSLSTGALVRSQPLSPPAGMTVTRVQGAKVFEGSLYMASDDAAKNLFKVNLDTGTVTPIGAVSTTGEQEGIAFVARPDGSLMHTTNVSSARTSLELRHHKRSVEPLRKAICP